ncbi:MAG: clostripain-related cysteine peptidase [bacterium]|nr:clostripain-related cysteine peptidase [bacterium]
MRLFFYFGHEIPEFDGLGYDASHPERTFMVHELADGLKRITRDSTKFDIIVLSTCFGGTPHTIGTLAPYARTIVASPDNLHLSYFDLHPFERLEVGLRDGDVAGFAKYFARQAFDRLTEDIQTAVTVAVYDVDRVQGYVHAVDSVYNHALATLKGQKLRSVEHYDCAEDSACVLPGMSDGVDVWYRPPRFGRSKHKQHHSGWECPRTVEVIDILLINHITRRCEP